MIYQKTVTTPANTLSTNPLISIFPITRGLIYRIRIYAPHGAMGLHYVQIWDGNFQLWPTTPGEAFRGDGYDTEFEDLYLKLVEPYFLKVKTWNLDDTYEHIVWINVGIVSEESFMLRFLPTMTSKEYQKQLASVAAAQEAEKKQIIQGAFRTMRF